MNLKPNLTNNSFLKLIPFPIRNQLNKIRYKSYNRFYQNKSYKCSSSHMFWFSKSLNFGDWITPYLFEKIRGEKPVFSAPNPNSSSTTILSVGSIISESQPNSIIWGSGIMSRNLFFAKPLKTLAVRGPISRLRFLELGYDCPQVYGDPALLLPSYFNPTISNKYKIGMVPHYVDYQKVKNDYQNQENITVINVLDSVESVVSQMLECENIVSSSLHGCIIANAYSIDFIWTRFSNDLPGDDVKFYDHFQSINLDVSSPFIANKKIKMEDYQSLINNSPQIKAKDINTTSLLESCPFI